MSFDSSILRIMMCRELQAAHPLFSLERRIDSCPNASPKQLDVHSTNREMLKIWDEAFSEAKMEDFSEAYLSTFDQYSLCRNLLSISDRYNPGMKDQIESLLSPRTVKFIPFVEVERLLKEALPTDSCYLLNIRKVVRVVRNIPMLSNEREIGIKEKQDFLTSLDSFRKIDFFEPFLLLNKEEMKEMRGRLLGLCHPELGKDFKIQVKEDLEKCIAPSLLKEQLSELGPLYVKRKAESPVVTKNGVEGTRQSGIWHLLAALDLHHPVLPGNFSGRLGTCLVMPYVALQSLSASDLSKADQKSKDALAFIGVVHALLHVHDGGKVNVKLNPDKGALALDLAKSLIPFRTIVSYSYPDCSRLAYFLSLHSVFTEKPYRGLSLPKELISTLGSPEFLKGIATLRLRDFLPGKDPLKSFPEYVANAEIALKERGKRLHQLAKEKADLTVQDVFEALFPEEMAMIKAGEEAGLKFTRGVDIVKIRERAMRSGELEEAYQTLIRSKIDVLDYAKLNK